MSSFKHKSIWLLKLSSSVLIGVILCSPLQLLAEGQAVSPPAEQPVSQPVPPVLTPAESSVPPLEQPVSSPLLKAMEEPHDYLSEKIVRLANSLDHFFGGNRHYQESNDSAVQLDFTRVTGYGGDRKFNLAAKANLRLPATEGRLHLLLETDPEQNTTDTTQDQVATNTNNKGITPGSKVTASGNVALAGRYENAPENFWHFKTDAGLKFPIPIKPFVRSRASFAKPVGDNWRLKAAESVYWFNTLGVGETTQLDLERLISEPMLFRASSNATWLNDKQNFDLRQDFSVYHTLDDRTALLYQASVIGVSNPQYQVMDYVVLILYRYRLHKDWMFLELSPQLHFPRERNYRLSPTLSMRLEVLFEGAK
ncbi:MAG: hypothetical protein ABI536_00555 [Gallionella sp.]